MNVAAVLLAAGGGTRFRGEAHKLIAELGGRPVYQHAVDAVTGAGLAPIVVVTGAVTLTLPDGVTEVRNPRWADGQAGSLQSALAHLREAHPGVDAVVVGLADQPFVPADAWAAVASAPPEWPIVVASYDGRRGPNPVRLHRSTWPTLPTSGDEGAAA